MRAARSVSSALGVAILLAGCTAPGEAEVVPAETHCRGVARAPLSAVDRKIVGAPAPYAADGALRGRDAELSSSQRSRRTVAWNTVAKVLAPLSLAESLPHVALPSELPAWQTWYSGDELRRIFHHLYEPLPTEQKANRAHFAPADLDDAFLWNETAVEELPTWPEEQYLAYLEAIDEAGEVAGLGGIARVSYSSGAARHLLDSYPEILACRSDGVPPARQVGPLSETPVARLPVAAAACERRVVGSYAIGEDESLHAVLDDGAGARLTLGDARCDAGAPCEVFGPATVDVALTAGAAPIRSVLSLTRRSTKPAWSACLKDPFPIDAVIVKADYRRADFDMTMPVYATSSEALAARRTGAASWTRPDGEADPPASDIYTLTLPSGAHYRLAALHVMTKELDHWLWITLWWSASPSIDFGADRPTSLGAPWDHYKMCVVTAFEEGDPQADGGLRDHPTLGDALSATYDGVGAPTWCSNPYLEVGAGNANSHCIGCHQHGGTSLTSADVLLLPDHGRGQLRNNFPADYSFVTTTGDNLGAIFADAELYFLGPNQDDAP